MGKAENDVKNDVISALIQCQAYLRFWVNATGVIKADDRYVKFGTVGSADILGLARPNGRFFGIELKSNRGKLSDVQERWRDMIQEFGGIYIVAQGDMAKYTVLKQLDFYAIIPREFYIKIIKEIGL